MKFTIKKNIILDALNNVTKALSQKTITDILNGIVFDIKKDGIELLASGSELTIKCKIDEKDITHLEGTGKIIIQSKYFLDIIRKMPSDTIDFEIEDNLKIKISTPTNQYHLNCYNPNDYPSINIEKSNDVIKINSKTLKEIINETSYALSSEVRPLLTGLNLKINGDILECIATDSYRLAKKSIRLEKPINKLINIIIPGRSITELEKIISDEEEDVDIYIFTNKILFVYKNIYIQSSLLNGTYPEVSQLIPTEFAYIVNLNLREFYDAIDRAALLAQNKDKNFIKMNIKANKMIITATSNELGNAEERLDIDSNNKDELEISLKSNYMMDALRVIKEENILLLLNAEDKPIIIKSLTDESLIQLIEPVQTF